MNEIKKRCIKVRVDVNLETKLKGYCEETGCTLSWLIRKSLNYFIDEKNKKNNSSI